MVPQCMPSKSLPDHTKYSQDFRAQELLLGVTGVFEQEDAMRLRIVAHPCIGEPRPLERGGIDIGIWIGRGFVWGFWTR